MLGAEDAAVTGKNPYPPRADFPVYHIIKYVPKD